MAPLVQRNLGEFSAANNDSAILIDKVEKKNFIFVRDRPALDSVRYSDYKYRKTINMYNEKVHCPFAVAKKPLLRRGRAFAYPKNTKWSMLFDPELLSLVEGGIVKKMLWEDLPDAEICPQNLASNERQLRNGDLMTTYFVMIAGFIAAFVVFVSEMFFSCINEKIVSKIRRPNNVIQVKSAKDENMTTWATRMSRHAKLSPPPSYNSLLEKIHTNKIEPEDSHLNGFRQIINGREYRVFTEPNGRRRLVPLRVPSAALFTYFTYNTPYTTYHSK